jgi:hypothetical protein
MGFLHQQQLRREEIFEIHQFFIIRNQRIRGLLKRQHDIDPKITLLTSPFIPG